VGFFKKVWRETARVVDSPLGAAVMPYTALASAASGSKTAQGSLVSTYGAYAAPVAGYFGGPAASQIVGQLADTVGQRFLPPTPTERTEGGGGGGGGGYFAPPASVSRGSSIPGWVWAVGAAVVGLVVLLIRKR